LYNGNCGCKKFYFQAEIQYSDLSGGFKNVHRARFAKGQGSQVWFVSPTADMLETLKIMAEKGVGALLVVEGEEIKGIVSERDFARVVARQERCALNTTVLEYMTTRVVTVTPDQSIEDCMRLMTKEHIRHLPVVEGKKLVGLISIGDVVKEVISGKDSKISSLENYIEGRW